jgi:hypothetical protein
MILLSHKKQKAFPYEYTNKRVLLYVNAALYQNSNTVESWFWSTKLQKLAEDEEGLINFNDPNVCTSGPPRLVN